MTFVHRNQTTVFLIILWLLIFVSYLNVIDAEFQFDDYVTILTNLNIKDLEGFKDPKNIMGIFSGQRFVTDLTFAVNYYYDRLHPRWYHIVSIGIHFFAACLVFVLSRKMAHHLSSLDEDKAGFYGFMTAAVFGLHPLNTQAVSYISQRAEILSTLFFLAAIILFLESFERSGPAKGLFSLGVVVSFLFSVWSKLTTISFAGVLFVTDLFVSRGRNFLKRLPVHVPVAALTVMIAVNFIAATGSSHDIGYSLERIDARTYLLTQFRVVLTYVRLLFLPINQNLDYQYRLSQSILEWDTLASLLCILGLIVFASLTRKRYPILAFGIFWFFMTLMPTSSVVPVIDVIFEHRVYLPSVGFAFCASFFVLKAVDLADHVTSKRISWNRMAGIISVLLLGAMVFATVERNWVWQSKMSLWADVVKKSPDKPRAYMNYGQALSEKGFYKESIPFLIKGLECPDDGSVSRAELYRELGVSYYKLGMLDEAVNAYQNGRKYAAQDPTLLNNLSIALYDKGDNERAQMYAELAIQYAPQFPDIYNTIGNIHFRKGEYEKALGYFTKATELNPDTPLSYWNLGLTFENLGDVQSAYYYLQKYVSMTPDESQRQQALFRLKNLDERTGRKQN